MILSTKCILINFYSKQVTASNQTIQSSKRSNSDSQSTETTTTKKQKLDNVIKQTDSIDLNKTETIVVGESLPEGFFDDPDLDAKVRGQSREANLEAEYEEFKKIIQNEEFKSDLLVEKDDKLRDFERDIEEVDDLIDRWNKIENLHIRREAIKQQQTTKAKNSQKEDEKDDEDEEEVDLENVLNLALRSKNRF